MNNNPLHTHAEPIRLSGSKANTNLEWDSEGFMLAGRGPKSCTMKVEGGRDTSQEWQHKQDKALAEYQGSHILEQITATTHSIYKLFGAYIGATLHGPNEKLQPNVLDVGCGIGQRLPMYMRKLIDGVNYFGMDAFDINSDRDYPFICARLEDLSEIVAFHNKFDVFVFGTSLDHFENIDEVARAVKKIAAPGAVVIFWIGLHDTSLVASEEGANALRRTFNGARPLVVMWRLLRFAFWNFPRIFYALERRRVKLKRGENLDNLHFWYFTEKDLPSVLARFGEITDISMVPGSNSVFATCRVPADGQQ